jgi:hypothetical protein
MNPPLLPYYLHCLSREKWKILLLAAPIKKWIPAFVIPYLEAYTTTTKAALLPVRIS